jgi:hypothetical protein
MKASNPSPLDVQIGGSHYKGLAMQPVQFSNIAALGFCEGNVVKYLCRWRKKNGLEDIDKVRHYLELLLEAIDKNQHNLPLIYTIAPLQKFLAQFPELTAVERTIIQAVTMWRRSTVKSSAANRRQIHLLREALKNMPAVVECYLQEKK